MSVYRDAFPHRHTLLPVIHVESESQALRNANRAYEADADGVFLISHTQEVEHVQLANIAKAVKEEFLDLWVGVNFLDLSAYEAILAAKNDAQVHGVWVDSPTIGYSALEYHQVEMLEPRAWMCTAIAREEPRTLYFGSVAFKYQPSVPDVAAAARIAVEYMDVVTTSGEGTGLAADPAKVRRMKEAIGDHPLALASGVTPENVSDYLDHADCFLVASGINEKDNFYELDPRRLEALVGQLDRSEVDLG